MTGSFKIGTASTDINARLQHGKFRNIVTVSKDDIFADFNCADAVYGGSDAACIQAALNYVSSLGGGHLHITGGHYICNSQLLYTNGNLIFTGDGKNTILDFSGAATDLRCIAITGSISTTNALLGSDVAASALTISVSAGNGVKFTAGDWIRIRSEAIFNNWLQRVGEIQRIKSIDNDVITLDETLFGSYAVSDTATCDIVNVVENIIVKNLKIVGRSDGIQYGIIVANVYNAQIENITSENMVDRAVHLSNAIAVKFLECTIRGSNRDGYGYGFSVINASRDIVGTDNNFYDCRHAVSCGGDYTYGVQYNQTYSNNTESYNVRGQSMFGQHNTYDGMIITGNTVAGDGLGYFAGKNTIVSNNNVHGCYNVNAIRIFDSTKKITVSNNHITTIGSQCIAIYLVDASTASIVSDVTIAGNYLESDIFSGVICTFNCDNLTIYNNTIVSHDPCIYIRNDYATQNTSDLHIENNNMRSDSAGILVNPREYDISNIKISNNIISPTTFGIQIWGGVNGGKMHHIHVTDNMCTGGETGIVLTASDDALILQNKIKNAIVGISIKTQINGCSDYAVTGNKISDCTIPISDVINAGDKTITGNIGYVTENTGSTTIPASATSITVTHGLAATPTNVTVTPKGNIGSCWWDTPTSTTFIIHCSTAPASDVEVNWTAIV